MSRDAAVRRQELRRSNAAVPHRNRYREVKVSGFEGDDECDLCNTPCECDCWHDNVHDCGCYD